MRAHLTVVRRLLIPIAALWLAVLAVLSAAASPEAAPAPLVQSKIVAQAARKLRLMVASDDQQNPLSELPFLAAALASPPSSKQRLVLLEQARRRNPLNLDVRSAILTSYLRHGMTEKAVSEILTLLRLLPETREQFYPLLIALILEPETSDRAIASIGDSPVRPELMGELARANASPLLLMSMSADLSGAGARVPERSWLSSIVEPYAQSGDLEAAWLLWTHFNGVERAEQPLLQDKDFALTLQPPFGWALSQQPVNGYSEVIGGVLRITDQGEGRWTAAQQLLRLPPGSYQLQNDVMSGSDPPTLAWRVECVSEQSKPSAQLLDWKVTGPRPAASGLFTVPAAGCAGQWLRLVVLPPELPETRSAMIGKLTLVRRGNA